MKREEIGAILNEIGVEISDDAKEKAIKSIISIHGADIEKQKTKASDIQAKLDEANTTISELNSQIEANGNSAEAIEGLKKQIKEYQDKETARQEAEAKAKADAEFNDKINPLFEELGIKNNAYIRNGLINDAKARMQADNTLGLKDILVELTKDNDDFKVNPNAKVEIPGLGNQQDATYSPEQIAKMSPTQINENWDAIKNSLGKG